MSRKNFFPPFLNVGSHDTDNDGPVRFLQRLLIAKGCAVEGFVADGEAGPKHGESIALFQREQGLEQDGNFGSETRAAWERETGLNVDLIPSSDDSRGSVSYIDEDGAEPKMWP